MINPNLDIDCTSLAKKLLFTKIINSELDNTLYKIGLQYRKGKSMYDIPIAISKGLKAGLGKTEYEVSMVALYLSKVFKLGCGYVKGDLE